MELRGATVLVTGGSSGIGRAIAKTLSDAGAKVAITGRDEKRLTEAAHALNALPVRADVSNEADVLRTYEEVLKAFGHLDVLVNNAGKGVFKPLIDMQRSEFDAVLATNMTGAMLMAREAAKHFISRKQRQHRQHRVHGEPSRRTQRHRLLRQQGRTPEHDRMLARGAPATQYSRYSDQSRARSLQDLRPHPVFEQKDNPYQVTRATRSPTWSRPFSKWTTAGFTTELTVFATNPKD